MKYPFQKFLRKNRIERVIIVLCRIDNLALYTDIHQNEANADLIDVVRLSLPLSTMRLSRRLIKSVV